MATGERSFKTQDFTVPSNRSGETIQVRISEPNLTSENLGLETWAASHILASQLHHIGPKIQFPTPSSNTLPILELGAGTGLVGVTASTLWEQPVVLTDLAPLVPALDANIDLNLEGLEKANTYMEAGTLDWKYPTTLLIKDEERPQTEAHVIFAADTIYSEEHPELLANVILKWLRKDKEARFIIAYPLRVCYIDYIREMWERLEEGGLEAIEEGREEASEDLFNDERLVEWSVWRWKNLDRHSSEDKSHKLHLPRLTSEQLTTTEKITALKAQIFKRKAKIDYYESLHTEHMRSLSHSITPYIRHQMEHEATGRGIHKGSLYQMHLMMNLRIRVQTLRDQAAHWIAENTAAQTEIKKLSQDMGWNQDEKEDEDEDDRWEDAQG
ncbi:hypothetical protein E4T47_05468 [Aureobasidium subglaciale]|nr:hypothetical protein E4T47_05468 [Aureobasidium subglaciale]